MALAERPVRIRIVRDDLHNIHDHVSRATRASAVQRSRRSTTHTRAWTAFERHVAIKQDMENLWIACWPTNLMLLVATERPVIQSGTRSTHFAWLHGIRSRHHRRPRSRGFVVAADWLRLICAGRLPSVKLDCISRYCTPRYKTAPMRLTTGTWPISRTTVARQGVGPCVAPRAGPLEFRRGPPKTRFGAFSEKVHYNMVHAESDLPD